MLIAFTYLPGFVTLVFRGMPTPEFEDHSTRIVGPHGKSKRYTMVV